MTSKHFRTALLTVCTLAAFATSGRAPGAVNPRTRDIETIGQAEGRSGRDKRALAAWQSGPGRA